MKKNILFITSCILIPAFIFSACAASEAVENTSTPEPATQEPTATSEATPTDEVLSIQSEASGKIEIQPTETELPETESAEEEEELDVIIGESAYLENIEIIFLESFPLQVQAVLTGSLPDGCTKIDEITVEKEDEDHFVIHVITRKPQGLMCTQALVPFEETVELDVYGLPAGTYTVSAGEVQTEFTFEQDNSAE